MTSQTCESGLHAHSHFSVLDALPTPQQMVAKAQSLNRPAIALTDHGSVSGHVLLEKAIEGIRTGEQGREGYHVTFRGERLEGIKPIYGVEAYLVPNIKKNRQKKNHVTLLAMNQTGYRNLIQLVTRSYDEGFYYRPSVDFRMLSEHSDGVIAMSGCESSLYHRYLAAGDEKNAVKYLQIMDQIYGENFYAEVQHFPHAKELHHRAYTLAEELGFRTAITCDCHYLEPEDRVAHKMIMAVRDHCGYDEAFDLKYAHPYEPDRLLRGLQKMYPDLDWLPAFETVADIVSKIEHYRLPKAPIVTYAMDGDKIGYMRQRCLEFLRSQNLDAKLTYIDRLNRELAVIGDKGYEDYFLVVADIINWAKSNGIMVGPGRGSAAGSLVCWGLGITTVDPVKWDLLFERFVDPTRVDPPDIDIDFEDERRSEVFDYIKQRYGEENVAFISTFMRFGGKQSLWDTAKVFGIPDEAIHRVIRYLPDRSSGDQRAELTVTDALDEPEVREVFAAYPELEIAGYIQGKIRGLGRHAAGVIVTAEPISNYAAIYRAPGTGERLVALDWRDATHLNLMKIDVLGLKECSMLRMMAEHVGMKLQDIYDIPLDQPEAIDVFNKRDFLGIFQFDGQAVRMVGSQMHFESLEQIAAVNALARPGPLWSQATAAYIQGRKDGKPHHVVEYEPARALLERTYGQIIYQESVMQILREIGGMGWQEVCEIRSIMGKSLGSEAFDNYFSIWEEGCRSNNVPEQHIRQIWETIRSYGRHAFNISHAFVYGLLAYWGAWFKANHPLAFYWAHLCKARDRDQEERFLIEAKRRGIEFGTLSLRTRSLGWEIRDGKIAPGWSLVPGIGSKQGQAIIDAGPFENEDGLLAVKGIGQKTVDKIMEYIDVPIEQFYAMEIWETLENRTPIADIKGDDASRWKGEVVGRVTKINKKSRIEEATSRGKEPPNDGGPDEYCTITVQDDTDNIVCWIDNLLYEKYYDTIWSSNGELLRVRGERANFPLIVVKDIELIKEMTNV